MKKTLLIPFISLSLLSGCFSGLSDVVGYWKNERTGQITQVLKVGDDYKIITSVENSNRFDKLTGEPRIYIQSMEGMRNNVYVSGDELVKNAPIDLIKHEGKFYISSLGGLINEPFDILDGGDAIGFANMKFHRTTESEAKAAFIRGSNRFDAAAKCRDIRKVTLENDQRELAKLDDKKQWAMDHLSDYAAYVDATAGNDDCKITFNEVTIFLHELEQIASVDNQ